ncbi:MAG: alpha-L-arabinofuranosidase [Bacteroidaceae bacterium]|nr:alpha-L-arabinofuranosidase [Bacteroidaceae bacterium]
MKTKRTLLPLLLTLLSLCFSGTAVADTPAKGWLRPYVSGRGLAFEYSADSIHWARLGHGRTVVDSDFGTWGAEKKMSDPCLTLDTDGTWTLRWIPNRKYNLYAVCTSPDLIHWKPQDYPELTPEVEQALQQRPTALQVNWSLIERLKEHFEWLDARDVKFSENLRQDEERFAGLEPLSVRLTFDANDTKSISDELIGVFFEDISYGADGGLYAELIQNRDFEYYPGENRHDPSWGPLKAWDVAFLSANGQATSPLPEETRNQALAIGTDSPIHPNNPHYAILSRRSSQPIALINKGYDGISVSKGETYDFSLFTRKAAGSKSPVKLKISLRDAEGNILASTSLKVSHSAWKKKTSTLRSAGTTADASLFIEPEGEGTVHLDMISLFPRHTFKNRRNGLRADLAQTIADLHPKFIRFPGGCVAHGDGLENMYLWKNSIGALEERKPMRNIWNYHQTLGLGYYEYFLFCEDIGAEPLPVIPAGVPCQNSSEGGPGQQGGVPREEMEAFTQDILDLIEWANGDAKTTYWGKVRAQSGHPKPFNLKHIGIGNEDLISEVFTERFTYIYNKVHARYPDIKVCGTVGPFYEGSDYEWGWKLASELGVDMVDEHYYVSPGWMINNQDYYDDYDREKPKVYLGEYAVHTSNRSNCIESALCEALYLTNVERNADVVSMTSYAPLLCREGHANWNPDMIYFNGTSVRLTPGYYVQQMFSEGSGDHYVGGTFEAVTDTKEGNAPTSPLPENIRKRISYSCVTDAKTGDIFVKIVNLLPVKTTAAIDLSSFGIGSLPAQTITRLSGQPSDTDVTPVMSRIDIEKGACRVVLPPYSFEVLHIQPQ